MSAPDNDPADLPPDELDRLGREFMDGLLADEGPETYQGGEPSLYARENVQLLAAATGGQAADDWLVLPLGDGRAKRLRVVTLERDDGGDQVVAPPDAQDVLVIDDRPSTADQPGGVYYRKGGGTFALSDADVQAVEGPGKLREMLAGSGGD